MSDYCVIGSGISGATIANLLNKKFQVNLYDKGRGCLLYTSPSPRDS